MSEELIGPLWETLAMAVADRNRRPAEELLRRLLKAVRHHLGMEVSFISEFTGGERVFRYVDSVAQISVRVGDSDPLEETYCQRVVDGRLPELICVAWELPAAMELPITAALPIGAHIAVPLILSSGRVYGTFCAFSRRANRSLAERDLAIVHMFADIASQFIEDDLTVANQYNAALERIRSVLTGEANLKIVFQPMFKLATETLIGVEALSRFPQEPSRTPDIWFSEAASIGLGVDLEVLALRSAVAALESLPEEMFLSVNASPEVVLAGRLSEAFAGVDPRRLILEITEHAPIDDYKELNRALQPQRLSGMRVAIDDAGAGYASLRHILWLNPDIIKLDMSITRDVDRDLARAALASTLIDFSKQVDSMVVAEGVETRDELFALRDLGVDAAQGYYLGRPTDLTDVIDGTHVPWARRSQAVAI